MASQHICFITPGLELGGAERSLVKLANAYVALGQKVTIISFTDTDGLQYLLDTHITLYALGNMSSSNPVLWLRVRRLIEKIKPDMVFGWSLYANLVAALVSGKAGFVRLILSDRLYLPLAIVSENRNAGLRSRLSRRAIRCLYPRANVITANSKKNLRFLQQYVGSGPEYIHLPNMIDADDISGKQNQQVSELPKIAGPHILAVGRLCYQKGFDVLLDAWARVREHHPWSLVVVGSGPEEQQLKQQARELGIEDTVYWLGARPNPFPYYKWADLVVVPSRFEGFPNVPLEAMACAKAVICTDCNTGPAELTQGGCYGKLVAVDDVDALFHEILALGQDPEARMVLGVSAQKHIRATYDNSVVQDCLLELLGHP